MTRKSPLGLLLPLLSGAVSVYGAETSHTIEELVITAPPHRQSADDMAGAVSVLSGNELRKNVAATLGETLQNQPGMNNSGFGPNVGRPVLRGLSGKRVGILQDGTGVSDAAAISPDHAVATEPLLADRIEILRGPATLRFGPGAIGGVVNVIENSIHTQPFEGFHGAGEVRHSSNNDETAGVLRLDGGLGGLTFHASGLKRDSNNTEIPGYAALDADPGESTDGFIDNTQAEADSWTLGSAWVSDKLVAGFAITRLNSDYGIPPGAHIHHHEEEGHDGHNHDHDEDEHDTGDLLTLIELDQTAYRGKLLLRDLVGPISQWQLDYNRTDYRHREVEFDEATRDVGSRFEVTSDEIRLEALHQPLGAWSGTLGWHFNNRDFDATGPEAFVPPSKTRNHGLFVIESRDWGNGVLEAGLRHDRQTIETSGRSDIDHHSTNLSLSYLYDISDSQRLGLVLSRSERAPTAEELLSNGEHIATRTFEIGNPGLDTEAAWNLEINWHLEGAVDTSISVYHRQFEDYIFAGDTGLAFSEDLHDSGFEGQAGCSAELADFDNDPELFSDALSCVVYEQRDARFSGIEAEVTAPLTDQHSLRLWGDYVHARFSDGSAVPRMPPARLGAGWYFEQGPWLLEMSVLHALEQNDAGTNESNTDGYTRLDAALFYTREQWSLFIRGSNLGDTEIRDATSFLRDIAPQPGRNITAGVRYHF